MERSIFAGFIEGFALILVIRELRYVLMFGIVAAGLYIAKIEYYDTAWYSSYNRHTGEVLNSNIAIQRVEEIKKDTITLPAYFDVSVRTVNKGDYVVTESKFQMTLYQCPVAYFTEGCVAVDRRYLSDQSRILPGMQHLYQENVNFDIKDDKHYYVLKVLPYRFAVDVHSTGEDVLGSGDFH